MKAIHISLVNSLISDCFCSFYNLLLEENDLLNQKNFKDLYNFTALDNSFSVEIMFHWLCFP